MIKRIELLIQSQNLTSSQFADKIGIQRSGLSHILSGRNNPSLDFVQKVLAAFPDLNPRWFLQGKEKMYVNLAGEKLSASMPAFSPVPPAFPDIPAPEIKLDENQAGGVEEEKREGQGATQDEAGAIGNGDAGSGDIVFPDMPEKKAARLRKILLFYEDGTFEEYTWRKAR
ncbi:MAG: helix-turn-helix domain-containing protein [Bacteroidales bacterium]|nr:helix-turn-helix domain-containing protein [Bacteroidales bacterium]